MIPDTLKAQILLSVAKGMTIANAARLNGLKQEQARGALHSICRSRSLGRGNWLSSQVEDIQASPEKYIEFATKIVNDSKFLLREAVREQLIRTLKLASPKSLTPKYLSNITAEMLLENGLTSIAVSEIQEWLINNGTTLKHQAPANHKNIRQAKQSALLLSAYGFNVTEVVHLLNADDG